MEAQLDLASLGQRTLVKILLFFAFTSDEDIGLDPPMSLMKLCGRTFYYISVDGMLYRTVQDHSTDALLSSGAHVFKVAKVHNPESMGKFYVLKDLWPEKDRKLSSLH